MHKFFVFLLSFHVCHFVLAESICKEWFAKNIKKDTGDCLSECVVWPVGMDTFSCPSLCVSLCNVNVSKKYVFKAAKLYSLNDSEGALAAEFPAEALKAYNLSWEAEKICSKLYFSSQTNDESDACRHYVWAHLLTESFGRELAEKFLYAHENEPAQPPDEKAMDLANNNRGVSQAESRLKEKKFNRANILEDFKKDFKSGKIVVLKKRLNSAGDF